MVSVLKGEGGNFSRDGTRAALLDVSGLSLAVGGHPVLSEVTFALPRGGITSIIGPSGSGKSSLLRVLNRMWDGVPKVRISGRVLFGERDLYARGTDVTWVRTQIGMVFQRPTPFPRSVYDNIALTLKVHGIPDVPDRVRAVLTAAGLWDEVKDRLHASALTLSGGQQQRLCIARALAVNPEILLMDEPQSALDPASREQIAQLMIDLKETTTILLVTHHREDARRLSDRAGVMVSGRLRQFGAASDIFQTDPAEVWGARSMVPEPS
jgi:phosphate transport system ATP-binding protein